MMLIALVALAVACSGEADDDPILVDEPDAGSDVLTEADTTDTPDTTETPDASEPGDDEEDVVTIGDDIGGPSDDEHRCGTAPIDEWPLHNAVADGDITITEEGGVYQAVIPAEAGGSQAARNNPFIYLRLDTGEKVEITDRDSLTSADWHLAFKRVVIRTNSEDSGPGGLLLTKEQATTFDAITEAPTADGFYETDRSFDDQCQPLTDPIGNLQTAFNHLNRNNPSGSQSWYNYGGGVSPIEGDIYILRDDANEAAYKLEILSWDGGVYTLRWAPLN